MESNVPKFKSSYTPKTRYGQVVKDYYENNPTPSVNWMMGENTAYMNQYGSNYGVEDVEALSREYVLYRDANGLSANYNAALTPWVDQVRANAAATTGGVVTPTVIQPNAVVTPAPQAQPQTATMDNDPFFQQIAKNKAIDNTKLDGGVPAVAAAPAPAVASTAPTASTATPAATPTPTPAVAESTPNVDNAGAVQNGQTVAGSAQVVQTTPTAQATPAANNVAQQIMHNNSATYAKLEQSGLPTATIEAIKAQSGLGEISKNYQATVKQAETDYALAKSRYGQNAEYLAQSGLGNSGYSDAADNAAYAAMQQAKVAAGESALAAQAEGREKLWGKVATAVQEKETELLSFVTSKGLGGQEAINYLTANGVSAARAADLVSSQVDPIYNANLDKAAAAYIDAIEKGATPAEATLILGANGYGAMASAAVEKANGILNSEEYKAARDKVDTEEQTVADATANATYAELKDAKQSEEYIENYMKAKKMDYERAKAAYDTAQTDKLDNAFDMLGKGDVVGASGTLKSVLGISDEEWNTAYNDGSLGKLMRDKADSVLSNDSEKRGVIYANSIAWDIATIDDDDTDMIESFQENIDEWARRGILTGDNLKIARDAMAKKTNRIKPTVQELKQALSNYQYDGESSADKREKALAAALSVYLTGGKK